MNMSLKSTQEKKDNFLVPVSASLGDEPLVKQFLTFKPVANTDNQELTSNRGQPQILTINAVIENNPDFEYHQNNSTQESPDSIINANFSFLASEDIMDKAPIIKKNAISINIEDQISTFGENREEYYFLPQPYSFRQKEILLIVWRNRM